MTQYRYISGFSIEGVGTDTTCPMGTMWAYGDNLNAMQLRDGDFVYLPALAKLPESSDTSIDPFDGTFATASLPLELHNNLSVATTILPTATEHLWVLMSDVGTSQTTIDLGESGASGVVYLEDECILIGTDQGDGTYTGCTRGYWDTTAQTHDAGIKAYDHVPEWEDRLVKFWLYNLDTDTKSTVWRGYIQDIETNEKSTRVVIRCGELVGAWSAAEINRGMEPLDHGIEIRITRDNPAPHPEGALAADGTYQTQVRKQAAWNADSRPTWLQVDGSLAFAHNLNGTLEVDNASPFLGSSVESEPEEDGATSWPVEDKVHELLVVSRKLDQRIEGFFGADLPIASSTVDLAALGDHYPYHPYALGMALVMSDKSGSVDPLTFNVLGPNMGLGMGWAFTSSAIGRLHQYIDETPNLQIDHAILGWDGKPFRAWDVAVYRCWLPFGLLPVPTDDGQFTFRRFGLMDVRQYNEALGNKIKAVVGGRLQQKMAHGSTTETITARFGDLPWRDEPSRVLVDSEGNSKRAGLLSDGSKFELDFGFVDESNIESVLNNLVTQSVLAHYAMPRLWITCEAPEHGGNDYTLGEYAALEEHPTEDALLVDPDRNRISTLTASIPWCGFMYGRRPNYARRTYDLGMMLTNFRIQQVPRLRGPAMDVVSVDASSQRIYCADTSQYGFVDDNGDAATDNESFYIGDEVRPWSTDGTVIDSAAVQVEAIGEDATGPYIEVSDWWATPPSAGDAIRLASFDDYSNTDAMENVERVWTFLADADGGLGIEGEPGDRYGSEFAAGSGVSAYDGPYDGGSFIGLDSDAAAADESEDAYLDHRLRSNEFALYQAGDNVTTARIVPSDGASIHADDRILTSLYWSEFDGGGIPVWPGMSQMTLNVLGGVMDNNTEVTTAKVQIRAVLSTGGFGAAITSATLDDTRASGVEIRNHQIALNVPDVPRKTKARLSLQVRGVLGEAGAAAEDPEQDGDEVTLSNAFGAATVLCREDGSPLVELTGDDGTATGYYIYPNRRLRNPVAPHHLGSFVYRSTSIEIEWEGGGAGFVEYASGGVRARKTVTFSGGSGYHQQNTQMLYDRPRVKAFGIKGIGTDSGQLAYWSSASGGVADWQELQSMSVSLDSNDPVLDVEIDVIGTTINLPVAIDPEDPKGSLESQSPLAKWQFRATAYQLEDGQTWADATQVGQATITKEITCYNQARGGWMILRPSDEREWREGMLYPADRELVDPMSIPVELLGADKDRPVRVVVEAQLSEMTDPGVYAASWNATTVDDLLAYLVRCSAVEYPQ